MVIARRIVAGQNGEILPKDWGPPHMFNPFKKKPFKIDDFAKLVMTEAKKAGIAESLEYDPKSFVLKRGDQRTYLGNVFNDYCQADDQQKKRILGNILALVRQKKQDPQSAHNGGLRVVLRLVKDGP
jgi:hypothetical protein